ncbi:MAG TPA: hypothetical protein VFB78_06760 [Acidimicrobiales bacterium]|nr:hypothetical protein [Acidimicrobiales bacterium]
MPSERDELLGRVYKRASGLWWKRRFAPIAAATVVVVVAIGVPVLRAGDGQHRTTLAAQDKTTTTGESGSGATGDGATTTTLADDANTTTTRAPGGVVSTVVPPGKTTTTTRSTVPDRCRNNNGDDSCGPFHWASDPGANAPLTFEITFAPAHPVAGQEVTFTVKVVDPDATPIRSCGDAYDDQPTFAAVGCVHTMECAANYGAWDVPPKQRGEATFTYKHAFVSAGEHTAEFHAESLEGSKSAGQCAAKPNPYASVGSQTVKVTVG